MAHEIAKLILEHAESIADRKTAIQKAMEIGMPFSEIEEYLDWIDARDSKDAVSPKPSSEESACSPVGE
jgi:DNA-binding transcriptional MerR regulator